MGDWDDSPQEGLLVQGRLGSDSWEDIKLISGWVHADDYVTGDTITLYDGTTASCAQDGGWIDFAIDIPDQYDDLRMVPVISGNSFRHDVSLWSASLTNLATPEPGNSAPSADAGSDRSVAAGAFVTLNGSGSVDYDGRIVSYSWTQIAGESVTLSNARTAEPSFTAPSKDTAQTLTFSLKVLDDNGAWDRDRISVIIYTQNTQPPPSRVFGVRVAEGVEELSVLWNLVAEANGYRVQWKTGSQEYNESDRQRTVTGGSTTVHTITGLTAGTVYTVRVAATKLHANDGQPSSEVAGVPSLPPSSLPPVDDSEVTGTPRVAVPDQVSGVLVTEGVEQLLVSWDAVAEANGYKVQWKTGSQEYNESDRQRTVTGGSTTVHTITGLTAGTVYTVRVAATKLHANDGQPSSEVTGTPRVAVPDQVSGVLVTEGVEQLLVSWDAVAEANGYRVQWKTGSQEYNEGDRQRTVTGGSTTVHTITGLTAGTVYTVRVAATKLHANDGQPSSEVAGVPSLPPSSLPPSSPPPSSLPPSSLPPVDNTVQGSESGGCAIASDKALDNMTKDVVLNLFLIISVLLSAVSWGKCSKGKQAKYL